MSDYFTFIVSSTVNASNKNGVNIIDNNKRFEETIETINSIHRHVTNVRIVFIDNSTEPLSQEQIDIIKNKVDIFHSIEHNIFTLFVNHIGSKGIGEAYMMYEALKIIIKNNLIGKRIFKLSGRYRLADSFDIKEYDDEKYKGKFSFKINQWDVSMDNFVKDRRRVIYFETRFWSLCSSLLPKYFYVLQNVFDMMVSNIGNELCNYEIGYFKYMPHELVEEVETAHIEGITADTGVYKFE